MDSSPRKDYSSQGARRRLVAGEQHDLFQDIPEQHQDAMRANWREDVGRWEQREKARRDYVLRASIEGLLIFLADHVILDVPSVAVFFLCLPLGLGTGFLWGWLRAGRYLTIFLAFPAWIISKLANGLPNGYAVLFGAVVFVIVCAVDGLMRELRAE